VLHSSGCSKYDQEEMVTLWMKILLVQ